MIHHVQDLFIRDVRRIDKPGKKIRARFVLEYADAAVECELLRRDDGDYWIEVRLDDGAGVRLRMRLLDRKLTDCIATAVLHALCSRHATTGRPHQHHAAIGACALVKSERAVDELSDDIDWGDYDGWDFGGGDDAG